MYIKAFFLFNLFFQKYLTKTCQVNVRELNHHGIPLDLIAKV